jgi:hypothetical protein
VRFVVVELATHLGATTESVEWMTGRLLDSVSREELAAPNASVEARWSAITKEDDRGRAIGMLERLIFFIAIWMRADTLVVAWLAFKVASKWDVWKNIVDVPASLEGSTTLEAKLDALKARRQWGGRRYVRFMVGTSANLLFALIGVAVGREFLPAVLTSTMVWSGPQLGGLLVGLVLGLFGCVVIGVAAFGRGTM